jgi:ferredoxin-nitrite reductase
MWLVEERGVDGFKDLVASYMDGLDGGKLAPAVPHENDAAPWERRDVLGVHAQRQPGLFWVGASVPAGRITADDLDDFARVADAYGDGTARCVCVRGVVVVLVVGVFLLLLCVGGGLFLQTTIKTTNQPKQTNIILKKKADV